MIIIIILVTHVRELKVLKTYTVSESSQDKILQNYKILPYSYLIMSHMLCVFNLKIGKGRIGDCNIKFHNFSIL